MTKILWLKFCDLKFVTKILWLKVCENTFVKLKNSIVTVVIVTEVAVVVVTVVIVTSFIHYNLTPQQPMRCSRCSFSRFLRCFSVTNVFFGVCKGFFKARENSPIELWYTKTHGISILQFSAGFVTSPRHININST